MKANRFDQGLISCIKIISMGALLHIGFYLGTKIAKKMKVDSKKEVNKYKGIGHSAQKFAQEHLGVKNMMLG